MCEHALNKYISISVITNSCTHSSIFIKNTLKVHVKFTPICFGSHFFYLPTCVVVGPCLLLPPAARGIGAINKHNTRNENLYLYKAKFSVHFTSPNVVRIVKSYWRWIACVHMREKNQFKYNFSKEILRSRQVELREDHGGVLLTFRHRASCI